MTFLGWIKFEVQSLFKYAVVFLCVVLTMIIDKVFEASLLCSVLLLVLWVWRRREHSFLEVRVGFRKFSDIYVILTSIVFLASLLSVLYILFKDISMNESIQNAFQTSATIIIAASAIIFHFHLRSEKQKKNRETMIMSRFDAITYRYMRTEKKDHKGLILIDGKELVFKVSAPRCKLKFAEWSFGYLESAETNVIEVRIIEAIDEKNRDYKKCSQVVKYMTKAGFGSLYFRVGYYSKLSKNKNSVEEFLININEFYPSEWDNIILGIDYILDKITIRGETES